MSIWLAALSAAFMLSSHSAFAQNADSNVARNLAAACASCHGTDGVSKSVIPSLAGYLPSAMVQNMQDFRDGKRPATIMQQIARGYTSDQIELLARYFAAQKAR